MIVLNSSRKSRMLRTPAVLKGLRYGFHINNMHEKMTDWLRAVQFKCNTSENFTSKFWILIGWKTIGNFKPMISRKMILKILCSNFENVFSSVCNMIFRHFVHANFVFIVLIISNHTFALLGFSKSWNCTRRSGSCNFSFLKNSLMQINSKLRSKPYDYLY